MNTYIVHDRFTDDFLALGTARECAYQLGYKNVDCFYSQICSQKNRNKPGYAKRNQRIVITLVEENDDE